jgi:hypothetical protein
MENATCFAAARRLDAIFLGRLALDLYAQQLGARLEDVSSFAKYLGGSSANQAFGTARLGLKSAMLARVGDDHMGRFLVESLRREGCDVSRIKVDRERLTALVLLGIKDRDTFPLVFYRENCADMAISPEDSTRRSSPRRRRSPSRARTCRAPTPRPPVVRRWRTRAATTCAPCSTSTIGRCCGA